MKSYYTFTTPEIMVPFKCDVHPWMSAYAGVLDHPFYSVTNDKGEFEIRRSLGTYTIELARELETQTQTVTGSLVKLKRLNLPLKGKNKLGIKNHVSATE
ncbi:MAG: hypothetical protein ABDI07_02705 [Candidatus Kryptonium sp.]